MTDREALFEEAHTPTDDEREALISLSVQWTGDHAYLADAILAAGFRRSSVQEPSAWDGSVPDDGYGPWGGVESEPSAEEFRRTVQGEPSEHFHIWSDLPCKAGECRMEPQGEPSDVRAEGGKPWCAECGGPYPLDTWPGSQYGGHWDTCPKRHAPSEPQGEPSDAPAVQLMARKGGKTQALIDQMLKQANEHGIRVEVIYPQGEPSDAQVRAAFDVLEASAGSGTLVPVNPGVVRAALRAAAEVRGER